MAVIYTKTFGDGVKPYITLGGEEIVRSLGIGSNWSVLKIGLLAGVTPNGTSNLTDVTFRVGLCSGTASTLASGSCLSGFGYQLGNAPTTATYNANSGYPYFSGQAYAFAFQNTVLTTGTGAQSNNIPIISANKTAFGVVITKGSPNYTATVHYLSSAALQANKNFRFDNFADYMDASSATSGMYIENTLIGLSQSGHAMAFAETFGALDTLDIYWNKAPYVMEIYAIGVARLS